MIDLEKMFRIGEISKLYHVGVDSLRYYEEIGLISPRRSESGYRLYSQKDIWRLNVIRDLRELGFPTEAIRDYLDFRNTDTALRMLQQEQDAIERKLEALQKLHRNVEKRMETIRIARELPVGEITLQELPDRRCYLTERGYSTDEEMDLLVKELLNETPGSPYIIGNNRIGSFLSPEENGSVRYPSVFALDENGDHVIPGGQYLCVTYQGDYSQSVSWVRRLRERAAELGLTVCGRVLELLWIDIHTSRDIQEHLTELQLPCTFCTQKVPKTDAHEDF